MKSTFVPTTPVFIVCIAATFAGCNSERGTISSNSPAISTESGSRSEDNVSASSMPDGSKTRADFLDKTWTIKGAVVDQNGRSIDNYDAASIWSSNGKYWNADGDVPLEGSELIWRNEGVLSNRPQYSANKTLDGTFILSVVDRPRAPVFAVNAERTHGGITLVNRESSNQTVMVKMTPLVRVTAELFCPERGESPDWGIANVYLVGGDNLYLTCCGTYEGRVSFLLPAGDYEISAKGDAPVSRMKVPERPDNLPIHAVYPRGQRFSVPADLDELNLGVLELHLPKDSDGNSVDTKSLYGGPAPELNITDARGVPKDMKLADFQGKWVILDFWALWCGPCVARSLPELAEFYAENAKFRDQFEILSICNTSNENILTISEYEEGSEAVRRTHWNGEHLPFPVLIDGEGKTYEAYGVSSLPTLFLLDPQGRIVEGGDLEMLADRLHEIREPQE